MLEPADHIEIRRVVDLYGYLIDERIFSRIGEVFTDDVVYDVTDFGKGVQTGIPAVVQSWREESNHPLAHHAINVIVDEQPDGTAKVVTKAIGVGVKGRVGSVTYYDTAVRTPDGWRLAVRRCVLRRPDGIPAES